jgi:hypothetical protein
MSSYIPIASQTLGSSAASVTFSSIPTTLNGKTLRDLVLVHSTAGTPPRMRVNSDTGSNYSHVRMSGNGSSATSGGYTDTSVNLFAVGFSGNPGPSTDVDFVVTQIFDYATTDKHKTMLSRHSIASGAVEAFANRWANTSAITSILIYGDSNFAAGSTFSLYGLEG